MQVIVTGATGFLGQAVCPALRAAGHTVRELGGRAAWDLRDEVEARIGLSYMNTDVVVHCAYPGTQGIGTALKGMASLVHDLLLMDVQVFRAAAQAGIKHVIGIGSVCAYPEVCPLPTTEESLWAGEPEPWNAPYGEAKRMQIQLLRAYERQYGLGWTHLILDNLYGPGHQSLHVIPATIQKCLQAKREGKPEITIWGTGQASREFVYITDAADAVVKAVAAGPQNRYLNICSGEEVSIAHLVWQVIDLTGYHGRVVWDPSKPDGQSRRWFSSELAWQELCWTPKVSFQDGLRKMVKSYV